MGAARTTPTPRVMAIVVAHDGAAWLPTTLAALDEQDWPNLDVIAVDNGSQDGCRDILLDHLGDERVLVAERDLGFGAAVNMAADTAAAAEADYLLLVHDDSAPAPDVVTRLVGSLEGDPSLAAVGPKLVRWDDTRVLESVGMTIDATGRADSGLEPDERDQGQRDIVHDTLYVPTSCMLIRQADYEAVGRLDRRYHVFRDDLDLCWRLWLADRRVEVVPDAVVRHASGASNYLRLGQTAFLGPRYFAERNTLATLLKLYGRGRLLAILPLFLLVGIAKVTGFVATRRIGDAWQTIRAWLWNGLHLRETLRLRRRAQAERLRTDGDLRALFGRVAPRLRAYTEAITFWLTTGDGAHEDRAPDAMVEPTSTAGRIVRFVRANAVVLGGGLLLLVGTTLALPLLTSGSIRGGELLPWPTGGAGSFFRDYASGFHEVDGLGTAAAPSPARFLLGLLTLVSFGSSWLAPRMLLLGALPLAWAFALLALRRVTPRRIPQVVAATLYVLSPPAVAAVRTGRIQALVVVPLLPALAAALIAMVRPGVRSSVAWRATAAAALVASIMVAFAPPTAALVVPATLALLAALPAVNPDVGERGAARLRLLAFLAGIVLLLFPWSLDLLRSGSPVWTATAPAGADHQPFWRLVLLAPDLPGFPGLVAGGGYLAAGVLGVVLALRTRTGLVLGLWGAGLTGALAAWLLGRAGDGAVAWPGLGLIIAAAAFSALLGLAFNEAGRSLGQYTMGWRHVLAGVSVLAVAAGFATMARHMVDDPWAAYAIGEPSLPAFIGVEQEAVGPFRVLVLSATDETVRWDITGPSGPTMLRFGQPIPPTLATRIGTDLTDMMGGSDPGAAARLGLANVRWIVVPEEGISDDLQMALAQQLDLEPQPVAVGRVYRVTGWLPRAAAVGPDVLDAVVNQGGLPPDARVRSLDLEDDVVVAEDVAEGAILLAEADEGTWLARVDDAPAEVRPVEGLVRVDVPKRAAEIRIAHAQGPRTTLMALQLVVLLLGISLVLRPPGFADPAARPGVPRPPTPGPGVQPAAPGPAPAEPPAEPVPDQPSHVTVVDGGQGGAE